MQRSVKFCSLEKWVILIEFRHWLENVVTHNCFSSEAAEEERCCNSETTRLYCYQMITYPCQLIMSSVMVSGNFKVKV